MAISTVDETNTGPGAALGVGVGPLALAGLTSIGAGAIHAAAIGVHSEHRQAVLVFTALALVQIAWGTLALGTRRQWVAVLGAAVNAAAVGGWLLAKISGITFVDGLDQVEAIQWSDGLAVGLAAFALIACLRAATARSSARIPGRFALNGLAVAVLFASIVGMSTSTTHGHAGGNVHDEVAGSHAGGASGDGGHHETPVVPSKVYDPAKPIDLSGVAGVSPAEQARAESLVVVTLDRLPKYSDPKVAEANGFASINDGITGHEHFINWAYVNDDHVLNPDYPEALVYEVGPTGDRKLVSAMYMLAAGTSLDDVPALGGKLTQWHIHDDLCLTDDPVAPSIAGITSIGGTCRPPTVKLDPMPMIHVWITKHPCGPFAALEGVGAGQVAPGETRLCDDVHGA